MLRKLGTAASRLLGIALLVLAALLVGVRLVGLTPYVVCSGSMEPVYPVGSILYVRVCSPGTLAVGQAVTFMTDAQMVATHQVWRNDAETRCIYTQGIANLAPDGTPLHDGTPVPYDRVLGRPVLCLPLLGYLAQGLCTAPGRCCVAAVLLLLLVFDLLPGTASAVPVRTKKEGTQ